MYKFEHRFYAIKNIYQHRFIILKIHSHKGRGSQEKELDMANISVFSAFHIIWPHIVSSFLNSRLSSQK